MRSKFSIPVVVAAVMAVALLGTPAYASAADDPPGLPDRKVAAAPGVDAQKPKAADRPAGKRVKGSVMKLSPKAAANVRMADGAQQAQAGCTPYITYRISTFGVTARFDYIGEIVCNFYLVGQGQAYLIERTPGTPYNGQVVTAAPVFAMVNNSYGYSYGSVDIDGRVYDGGTLMEVGFDLALRIPGGGTWAGCFELPPGLRYLVTCSGVGTDTVRVSVGTGALDTAIPPGRLAVLESLTSDSEASFSAWNQERFFPQYQRFQFDWSNDGCTGAPDNPLGFTFETACIRHDFGYRNYKAAQRFPQNKDRLDNAFYSDLKRVCADYPAPTQPACYSLAAAFYQAVRVFGFQKVAPEKIDEAAQLLPAGSGGRAPKI